MIIRPAQISDYARIASLHADSWRRTYRGLFSDAFFDHEADADRQRVWMRRLESAPANQYVLVAEEAANVTGFICIYGGEDPRWGALIDNLHVAHKLRRRGIGRQLMAQAFAWLEQHHATAAVYLWVMENNLNARGFYENLGASNTGVVEKPNPVGGGSARNCRYVWASPLHLCHSLIAQKEP